MTRCVITFDRITSGAATETFAQLLAGTNRPLRITEIGFFCFGVDNLGVPIEVQLLRQTTAGTGSARTIQKTEGHVSTGVDASGQTVFTAEPTAGAILRTFAVHPQTGLTYFVPEPEKLTVPGAGRIGLRAIAPPTAVDVCGYIEFEE